MVEAILFLARTGCQWRYLPERYGLGRQSGPNGGAGGRTASGAGDGAPGGDRRLLHDRAPFRRWSCDAQSVKGGRYGPDVHEAGGRGGRTIGTKRTILVEILALRSRTRDFARPHDVVAAAAPGDGC